MTRKETLFAADTVSRRLTNQCLVGSSLRSPAAVVAWLGGVQAQDEAGAAWSIGLRLPGATAADIEQSIGSGAIVRTWAMRGTLHYLPAEDVRGIVATLAPGIMSRNRRRYGQLGLDADTFRRSNRLIEDALANSRRLSRSELVHVLTRNGLDASGQRAPYLLQRASLDGLACLGPSHGGQAVFVSACDWLPAGELPPRDAVLGELAWRYFASHGPASWRDFAWWSGLSADLIRIARQRVGDRLAVERMDGVEYWSSREPVRQGFPALSAHLLPSFDEFLLGYRDRSASLAPAFARRVNAGGGMPKPTIVLAGRVTGTWQRAQRAGEVDLSFFNPPDESAERLVQAAVDRFAAFAR